MALARNNRIVAPHLTLSECWKLVQAVSMCACLYIFLFWMRIVYCAFPFLILFVFPHLRVPFHVFRFMCFSFMILAVGCCGCCCCGQQPFSSFWCVPGGFAWLRHCLCDSRRGAWAERVWFGGLGQEIAGKLPRESCGAAVVRRRDRKRRKMGGIC